DSVAQALGAPSDRVLIDVSRDGFLGGFFDLARRGEVREALGQIDRAVEHGLAGHLADYRFGEVFDFIAEKRLWLDCGFLHGLVRLARCMKILNQRGGGHWSHTYNPRE